MPIAVLVKNTLSSDGTDQAVYARKIYKKEGLQQDLGWLSWFSFHHQYFLFAHWWNLSMICMLLSKSTTRSSTHSASKMKCILKHWAGTLWLSALHSMCMPYIGVSSRSSQRFEIFYSFMGYGTACLHLSRLYNGPGMWSIMLFSSLKKWIFILWISKFRIVKYLRQL